jgi:hypothetical protein
VDRLVLKAMATGFANGAVFLATHRGIACKESLVYGGQQRRGPKKSPDCNELRFCNYLTGVRRAVLGGRGYFHSEYYEDSDFLFITYHCSLVEW